MDQSWLKRSMPRGLYGRTALILVVPVVALQIVVSIVFIQRHFEDVTRQMTQGVVLDLEHLMNEAEEASDAAGALENTADLRRDLGLVVNLPADDPEPAGATSRVFYDVSGITVIRTLQDRMPDLRSVDLESSSRSVRLQFDTVHGVMEVQLSRRLVAASNPHQFLVIMLVFGLLMTGVAFVYLRNQLRPVTQLAEAAEAFGKGRVVRYRPAGAQEVRAAGAAFLDMRNRIERQIEQRTAMLSGISHDLRTPLTRLRLGLSMLPESAERGEMERDVDEMEALIGAFLQFARTEAEDAPTPAAPAEVARHVVAKAARGGGDVRLAALAEGAEGLVPMRSLAVERALGNLVSNALRYGERAEVSVDLGERTVRFLVEDDGPGIAPERREEALLPFARLDKARNQDAGSGVGLGLSIARDIARSHGGRLDLGESSRLGGLAATFVIAR
ncbi:MAG: ATP-binding protein [Pseudomonadota bacterium]